MFMHKKPEPYYTVIGAYAYNPQLFDSMTIDDSIDVDKADIVATILSNNRDLIIYETNLSALPAFIGLWSRKNKENFKRIYQALYQEYNPLHNYDRLEDYTDTTTGTDSLIDNYGGKYTDVGSGTDNTTVGHGKTVSHTGTDNIAKSETATDTHTGTGSRVTSEGYTQTNTGTDQNSHKNTAFNAGVSETARDDITKNLTETKNTDGSDTETRNFSDGHTMTGADNRTLNTADAESGTTTENTTTGNRLEHTTSGSDTHERESGGTTEHTAHLRGNIGITTSQSMVSDECNLRMKYNFCDLVAESFRKEFCLLVY